MAKFELYFFVLIVFFLHACGNDQPLHSDSNENDHNEQKKIYTCPMDTQIIKNRMGQCPICGMDLAEKKTEGKSANDKDLELLLKPADQFVFSQVKTGKAVEKELPVKAFAMGYITYDARQINTISAKVSGRIEKLYVKFRYQQVSKGQKLMDIYSKELETEQQNLLFLLKNDPENFSLIKASEQKLLLLGLTQDQVNQMKSSGKTFFLISVYSPYGGHLHDIMQLRNSPGDGAGMEKNMASGLTTTQELEIKEGMYISKGQTIFNIYDTQKIWALLSIYRDDQNFFQKGQKIKLEIDGLKGRPVEATIDFIEPVIRPGQKNGMARVYLNNPASEIKIGAIVKATSTGQMKKGLFVPASSIVNLGLNSIVFIRQGVLFRSRNVQAGTRLDDWIEIISGISRQDTIAQNGQLLMDSESFIKTENK